MRLASGWTHTGLCRFCGKPTRLLIHQNCHAPDKPHKKLKPLVGLAASALIKKVGAA